MKKLSTLPLWLYSLIITAVVLAWIAALFTGMALLIHYLGAMGVLWVFALTVFGITWIVVHSHLDLMH